MSNWRVVVRHGSLAIVAVAALVAPGAAVAQPAPNAGPQGGVVVGGTASIGRSPTDTVVTQTSQRAAIDWQSVDVGSQQSFTVRAPNASAITLMIVSGPHPSEIAGRIDSNGQVIIVNATGATLFTGAQVNASGFVLSGPRADANAFMAGGTIDFDAPGNPNAKIVNRGTVTVAGAGLAALIAPAVTNAGVIDAELGSVSLIGATSAELSLYGDKLIAVQPTRAVTQAPNGVTALVTQRGTIRADGGKVRLGARAVNGVVANLISAGGLTVARTVGATRGTVTLNAAGGSVTVSGQLQAQGGVFGTVGGRIGLLATQNVTVAGTATVSVSGAAGGGTVAVGTTLKRATTGPSLAAVASKNVNVESGAVLSSSATAAGNGGRVAILSLGNTVMAGSVSAMGGPTSGNGGFVEISGNALGLTGSVNVVAPNGQLGTILLDPHVWIT
jgi:filamentous hemagglutinin family protein